MSDIHNLAVVSPKAKIGKNVIIGPFCVVGDNVTLGDGVVLHSHVVIEGRTTIGKNTSIFPFSSIGHAPQDLKYNGEDSSIEIGENNTIREYVTIQPGTEGGGMITKIADNCLLMIGTHIAHDCKIGNNVIFANLTTLAGHVTIGDYVVIGGLAAIHQWVHIGDHAMIGGGSMVHRDVVPFAAVSQDRAYIEGMNLVGLKRRGIEKDDILTLQKAFNKIFFGEIELNSAILEVENEFKNSSLVMQLIEFIKRDAKRSFLMPKKEK